MMGGPMIDPTICYVAFMLPIVITSVYSSKLRFQMKGIKKARQLTPLHLRAFGLWAVSSAFLIVLGAILISNPILVLYIVPGILFAFIAAFHWFEYRWYRELSKSIL